MKTMKTLNTLKSSTLILAVALFSHSAVWAQSKNTVADNSQPQTAAQQKDKNFPPLTTDIISPPYQLSEAEKPDFFNRIVDLLAEEEGLAVTFGKTLPDVTIMDSGINQRPENARHCLQQRIEHIDTIENIIINLDDEAFEADENEAIEELLEHLEDEALTSPSDKDEEFLKALDAFIKDYEAKHPPRTK